MRALLLGLCYAARGRAAATAAPRLALDRASTPTVVIPGIDKGGTGDAYAFLVTHLNLAAGRKKEPACANRAPARHRITACRQCYRATYGCDKGDCPPSIDATPNSA